MCELKPMADIKPDVSSTAGSSEVDTLQQDVVEIDNPFSEKTDLTDLALVVEGQSLFVSRLVMRLVSPVFRAMFEREMTEKDKDEIILPGKRMADMVEFLLCVYPGKGNTITDANVDLLLPLFDEYQVDDRLTTMCETVLTDRCNAKSTIVTLLKLFDKACTYRLENLKSKCVNLVSYSDTSTLISAGEKYPVPAEVWRKVTQRRDTEIQLLKALSMNDVPTMFEYNKTVATVCAFSLTQFVDTIKLARREKYEYLVQTFTKFYANELRVGKGLHFETELNGSGLQGDIKYYIALLMKKK